MVVVRVYALGIGHLQGCLIPCSSCAYELTGQNTSRCAAADQQCCFTLAAGAEVMVMAAPGALSELPLHDLSSVERLGPSWRLKKRDVVQLRQCVERLL
jgi:hypothetical protein